MRKLSWVFIFLLLTLYSTKVYSQGQPNWEWWAENVQWDGVTHWSRFIILSPGFMGPNALPVPEMSKGSINNELRLEVGGQTHFSEGDNTQNLITNFKLNLAKEIISIHASYVPIERFDIDDKTRDERRLSGKYYEPEGTTGGDIYFGFEVQILKNKKHLPNVAFRANTKTASGSAIGAARFTDASGYSFDFSFGKELALDKKRGHSVNLYSMVGFYAWQTNGEENRQNDAFLYGIGTDLNISKFVIGTQLAGYSGYVGNRDQPMVYRVNLLRKGKVFDYRFNYQWGLRDFEYKSITISLIYHLDSYNFFNTIKES